MKLATTSDTPNSSQAVVIQQSDVSYYDSAVRESRATSDTIDLLTDSGYQTAIRLAEAVSKRLRVMDGHEDAVGTYLAEKLALLRAEHPFPHYAPDLSATFDGRRYASPVVDSLVVTIKDFYRAMLLACRNARYQHSRIESLETMHYQTGWDAPDEPDTVTGRAHIQGTEEAVIAREALEAIPLWVRRYRVAVDSGLTPPNKLAQRYGRWVLQHTGRRRNARDYNALRDSAVRWYSAKSHFSEQRAREVALVASRADWTRIDSQKAARLYVAQVWAEYRRSVTRKTDGTREGKYNVDF